MTRPWNAPYYDTPLAKGRIPEGYRRLAKGILKDGDISRVAGQWFPVPPECVGDLRGIYSGPHARPVGVKA